ncbi:MAG: hypothetical protein K6A36_05725 [Paludibacteraceae bacterium]|nr:hypothetical protein [Paludibacteraceae bacterium]
MTKRIYIWVLLASFALCAHAETIVLHTGARVRGTIVFQNEEVVIVRDREGARYQYPRADVKEVIADVTEEEQPQKEEKAGEEITPQKKVSILLELGGGAAFNSNDKGGAFSVDLLVGSHHIGDRHILAGAGFGYHGLFIGANKYNFLPIQMVLRLPLTEERHAPVFGAALGYGVALSKNYLGGIYADLDFGYRCQLNPRTAISVVAFGQFQQAKIQQTEIVGGEPFIHTTGRYVVTAGLKMALYF